MSSRVVFSLGLMALAAVVVAGCSSSDPRSSLARSASLAGPVSPMFTLAAADTSHGGGGGGHGPKPPQPAVVFISADSAAAGDSISTRWQLHNNAHQAFTMPWVLTTTRNWPGFPKSGSVALGALNTALLVVSMTVPDTASAGPAPLTMSVTQKDGTQQSSTGFVVVH